jgi:hypothetical protein
METMTTGLAEKAGRVKAALGKAAAASAQALRKVDPSSVAGLRRMDPFDRRWITGCLVAVGLSIVAWLVYASKTSSLEQYLQTVQFDAGLASAIASFSVKQAAWFVVFLILSATLVASILKGKLAGPRAKLGCILLGLVLVVDLGRSNLPWLLYLDYKEKYASNPVIDFLRENPSHRKPYEYRVVGLPQLPREFIALDQLYKIEWAQHHFPYYNIQSLDTIQMSRVREDWAAFETALRASGNPALVTRRWQLTNTRYIIGPAAFTDALNQQVDPVLRRFRSVLTFDVGLRPGVPQFTGRLEELTAVPKPDGQCALIEFTGTLPRAKLYSQWQMPAQDQAALAGLRTNTLSANDLESLKMFGTNDFLTLKQIASPSFDPEKMVLVNTNLPAPTVAVATNQNPGTVEFASYIPQHIVLKADAKVPSVLLLNDRFDPEWNVYVDGQRAPLLRCNYIMRGVALAPGEHKVEFRFQPPIRNLYVSLAAFAVGLVLVGVLVFSKRSVPVPPTSCRRPSEQKGELPVPKLASKAPG